MSNLNIINAIWFTPMMSTQIVGIVVAKDKITGKVKRYIGIGAGVNEGRDAEHICSHGAKFTLPDGFMEDSTL